MSKNNESPIVFQNQKEFEDAVMQVLRDRITVNGDLNKYGLNMIFCDENHSSKETKPCF